MKAISAILTLLIIRKSSPILIYVSNVYLRASVPNLFGTRNWFCGRQFFHGLRDGGWFQNDLGTLYLFCTLFLLYFYQLHLRSSDIGSRRLGTPVLEDIPTDTEDWSKYIFQNVSRTWQWPYTPNFETSCSFIYVFSTWNIVRYIRI